MKMIRPTVLFFAIVFGLVLQISSASARDIQTAVVAGGCFWCVEADFEKVKGVVSATSGFTGGSLKNPTYKQVTKGGTGHYEAVKIKFDADVISYRELLDIFWRTVDPLDAGGQFCDRGASYRTAVFANSKQRADAEASKKAADAAISGKIVTPILSASTFYPADSGHQNYYKGTKRVITRYGVITQASAYKKYRKACGRDKRVRQIWGSAAPFAGT